MPPATLKSSASGRSCARSSALERAASRSTRSRPLCDVTTRTIRRDLQALEEAGFPIYDDRSHDDGRTRWTINGQAFKGLFAGLTLSELCALHFSRTLLESLAGTPFRDELESAFDKLGSSLTPHMRQFLDQLPRVIASKPDPLRRRAADDDGRQQQIDRQGARGDSPSPAGHADLLLAIERPDQVLPGPPLSARLRAGRTLSAGSRAGIRRGADVRRRAHRGDRAARRALHAARGPARRSISALAGRALGSARAGDDRIRAGSGRLRAREGVAPVAAVVGRGRRPAWCSPSTSASTRRFGAGFSVSARSRA